MPLYEYECDACAHRFEVIQKFSDTPIEVCPRCGGAVRKLLSSPAIQFKGSGWYITDYARAGKSDSTSASSGKGDAAASSSSDGGAAAKTETKSDSKPESKPAGKADSKPSGSSTSD
jgi:putative FmdB family regulatory protein